MSIVSTDDLAGSTLSDAYFAQSAPSEAERKHPNRSRVKLAHTTIYALEDMLDAAQKGRAQMEVIRKWIERERLDAKGRYDVARLARLGELDGMVADLALEVGALERLAADARIGIYVKRERAGHGNS